jgi:hypothetical protein
MTRSERKKLKILLWKEFSFEVMSGPYSGYRGKAKITKITFFKELKFDVMVCAIYEDVTKLNLSKHIAEEKFGYRGMRYRFNMQFRNNYKVNYKIYSLLRYIDMHYYYIVIGRIKHVAEW